MAVGGEINFSEIDIIAKRARNGVVNLLIRRAGFWLAGAVPREGPGRVLYDEMVELIRSNGDELVPVWSGVVGKKPLSSSWKELEKK